MSKHTPGPWRWINENALWAERGPYDYTVIECGDDGKSYGMHSAPIVHNADDAMAEANRRLIAAAPELLEALQGLLALDQENNQRGHDDEDVCSEVQFARAAIAKATGETP